MGMTDDPDVPEVSSVMDCLAHRIALDYQSCEQRGQNGRSSAAGQPTSAASSSTSAR
jgi:hypothetical protein